MANTYTRVYLHVIIRTKRGYPFIGSDFEDELYAYLGGIIKNQGHLPIKINGVKDHIHLLFAHKPVGTLSDLMREVKSESSRLINENKWVKRRFRWQVGFGAFSCDHRGVDRVVKYIDNQKEHHRQISYLDEYRKLLKESGIEYDERYLVD